MIKIYFVCIGLVSFLLLGCSRSVTDKGRSPFLNIAFDITFKGPVDSSKVSYLLIFSKSPTPNIALPRIIPGSNYYLPTPGRTFTTDDEIFNNNGGLAYYYKNYYSTWSDYIVAYKGVVSLYSSGGNGFNPTTSVNATYTYDERFVGKTIHSLFDNSTTLHLEFETQYLRSDNAALYFTIITSEVTDGSQSGYIRDALESQHAILIKRNEQINLTREDILSTSPDAADIQAWRVRIF